MELYIYVAKDREGNNYRFLSRIVTLNYDMAWKKTTANICNSLQFRN